MAVELPTARDPSRTSYEGILAGFCMLPLEDFLVWDSWITWEHGLRRAQHKQDRARAFLEMRLWPQNVMAERLTEEEQAWYKIWRAQYLDRLTGFEREIMEAGGIGPGEERGRNM